MSDLYLRPGILDLDFTTFLTVVRYGTLSQAADQLHVTQSTVSYRLRVLEKHLGLVLVDRGRGRQEIRLTADGEELLKLAERWEALHLEIQQLSIRGVALGVGAPDSVNTYVLADAYAKTATRNDLQIRVVTANSRELYELLDRHELDVAFPLYNRPSSSLHIEEFLREPMVVLSGSQFATVDGRVDISALNDDDEIQIGWPDPVSGSRMSPRALAARVNVDATALVLPFLRNKAKWTVVPASMGQQFAGVDKWHVYPVADPAAQQTIFKAARRRLPSATQRSKELFEQHLSCVRGPGRAARKSSLPAKSRAARGQVTGKCRANHSWISSSRRIRSEGRPRRGSSCDESSNSTSSAGQPLSSSA
jgi:DNA-binding transcriptional LysR family regulator